VETVVHKVTLVLEDLRVLKEPKELMAIGVHKQHKVLEDLRVHKV
jgi:hypothetical protein